MRSDSRAVEDEEDQMLALSYFDYKDPSGKRVRKAKKQLYFRIDFYSSIFEKKQP